jgi:serine protease
MAHPFRRLLTFAAIVSAVAGLALLSARAQEADPPPSRVLEQPVSAPAIDRGLLDGEPLREPRDRGGHRAGRVEGEAPVPYARGKVIVKFREETTAAERAAAIEDAGATASVQPPYADFEVMSIAREADPEAVARMLAERSAVEYAQAAYRIEPYFRPNDPLFSNQWNLTQLSMEQVWDINEGASSSVIVAVLDTGVAFESAIYQFTGVPWIDDAGVRYPALGRVSIPFAAAPDLAGASRFPSPRDFIWNDVHPVDMDGHGTHVSGTIGQLTNNNTGAAGMAFNVRIMPVKCISTEWDDIFDSPSVGTDDVVAQAIRYAADNGAKVINMSLGRSEGPEAPAIGSAIRYAVSKGTFVAVAAGNGYERGNPIERLAEQAGPIDGAMVVAATGPDRQRSYYSGVQSYVEIAAPGGNSRLGTGTTAGVIQQTFDSTFTDLYLLPPARFAAPRFDVFAYRAFQGTSMATPHVAGLAALLVSQGITKPEAVEAAIKRFASDLGAEGRDNEYGFGLINPRATLWGLGLIK